MTVVFDFVRTLGVRGSIGLGDGVGGCRDRTGGTSRALRGSDTTGVPETHG